MLEKKGKATTEKSRLIFVTKSTELFIAEKIPETGREETQALAGEAMNVF